MHLSKPTCVNSNLRRLKGSIQLLALLFVACAPSTSGVVIRPSEPARLLDWRISQGDDLTWALPEYDDTHWQQLDLSRWNFDESLLTGRFWFRVNVIVPAASAERQIGLQFFAVTSAQEFYWDGQLVHTNGVVDIDTRSEIPGRVTGLVPLPYELTAPGQHQLAIRISNFSFADEPRFGRILIGQLDGLRHEIMRHEQATIFLTAVFLTAAIFNLIIFLGFHQRIAYLFFALYCLFHAGKIGLRPTWIFKNIDLLSLPFHWEAVLWCMLLSGFFLVVFLLHEFSVPQREFWTWALAGFTLLSYFWIPTQPFVVLSSGFAFLPAIYAIRKNMDGSWLSLVGLIGFSLLTYLGYQNLLSFGYFVGSLFFVSCMTLSLGKQIGRQERRRQEAILKSSRLENELLKKNIQPHFIMNSLTSLQELLEQDSDRASQLIEALAEEFRVFSKVASEKLIPIAHELNMSRAHLRIMEFRREAKFTLETRGLNGDEQVPPAVFHTLIENGLTHGYAGKQCGRFVLSKELEDGRVRYGLFNDGHLEPSPAGARGTGLKYVEARLEESFPGCWQLCSEPIDGGWLTTIEITSDAK